MNIQPVDSAKGRDVDVLVIACRSLQAGAHDADYLGRLQAT